MSKHVILADDKMANISLDMIHNHIAQNLPLPVPQYRFQSSLDYTWLSQGLSMSSIIF